MILKYEADPSVTFLQDLNGHTNHMINTTIFHVNTRHYCPEFEL